MAPPSSTVASVAKHADQDRRPGAVDGARVDVVALDVGAEPGVGAGPLARLGSSIARVRVDAR